MARERGSTGYSSDVLDVGKMAASPQKVQVTASLMNTSWGIKVYDWNSSKEGAAESGYWPRSTTPPRRGWQSMHWSGVIKNYARALEGLQVQMLTWGVLVGVITCVGGCVCFRP